MFIKFTNLCFHIFKVIIGKYTGTKIKNLSTVDRHMFIREKRMLTEGQSSIKAAAYTLIIK